MSLINTAVGLLAISSLMGLLLSAIGVQMLVVGLKGCFPVLAEAG